MTLDLSQEINTVKQWGKLRISGKVSQVIGLLIESRGPSVHLGEMCYIYDKNKLGIPCEVVGFKEDKVLLMSLGEMSSISPGAEVYPTGESHCVPVGNSLCGRILNALGEPIDGKGPIRVESYYPVEAPPPDALTRQRIEEPLQTGVRSIDTCCTTGKGQRIGIFSGSGVGKSSLIGMISKMSSADINVIALIGERGREVREFIERDLGYEGLQRSVVIVATSDQAALLRARGAYVATAIAEYFRDHKKNVIFMMDSVTRYAMALREIGLATGEPPTTKGYTPSVFALLPKLLERSGNSETGSITGIYTILVEGDDLMDPIADQVRSILDGHIVLSRQMAEANIFPAVDIPASLSRVMGDIVSKEHIQLMGILREYIQVYRDAEDLINIGAYIKGSNPKIDQAIIVNERVRAFLTQNSSEKVTLEEGIEQLKQVVDIS
jgi:flagellum-specific ATP synthase